MKENVTSDENVKFQAKSYMTRIGRNTCEGLKVGGAKLLGAYLEVFSNVR
jgi:hypothetical protein